YCDPERGQPPRTGREHPGHPLARGTAESKEHGGSGPYVGLGKGSDRGRPGSQWPSTAPPYRLVRGNGAPFGPSGGDRGKSRHPDHRGDLHAGLSRGQPDSLCPSGDPHVFCGPPTQCSGLGFQGAGTDRRDGGSGGTGPSGPIIAKSMDPAALRAHLNGDRLDRTGVDRLVGELLDSPDSVKVLLEEIHKGEESGHFQASWVLDHLLRRKPNYLLPHMEQFPLLLPGLKNESCIRWLFRSEAPRV